MKACSGQLKVPHVLTGHKWTAAAIKAISNNGDLYIQATSPLSSRIGVDQLFCVPTPDFNEIIEEFEGEVTNEASSYSVTLHTCARGKVISCIVQMPDLKV